MTTTRIRAPHEYEIGDGATMSVGSDRYGGTVVLVSPTGHFLFWRRDHARRVDDNGYYSEAQTWEHEPDLDAPVEKFTRRRNGRYCAVGTDYCWLSPGRHSHRDPHF